MGNFVEDIKSNYNKKVQVNYNINPNAEQAKINAEMFCLAGKFEGYSKDQIRMFFSSYLTITKVQLEHMVAANDSHVNEAGNS